MASEKVTDELRSVESTVCIEDLGKKTSAIMIDKFIDK